MGKRRGRGNCNHRKIILFVPTEFGLQFWIREQIELCSVRNCNTSYFKHRQGGERIANCFEFAWSGSVVAHARSTALRYAVVAHRLWNQTYRTRLGTESENHGIHVPKCSLVVVMGPLNLYTKFCLLNWFHMRWSAIGASLIWYSLRQAWLDHFIIFFF